MATKPTYIGSTEIVKPYITAGDNWPLSLSFTKDDLAAGTTNKHVVYMWIIVQDELANTYTGHNADDYFPVSWDVGPEWNLVTSRNSAGTRTGTSSSTSKYTYLPGMQVTAFVADAKNISSNTIRPLDVNGNTVDRSGPLSSSSWYIILTTYDYSTIGKFASNAAAYNTTSLSVSLPSVSEGTVSALALTSGNSNIGILTGQPWFSELERFGQYSTSSPEQRQFVIDGENIWFTGTLGGLNTPILRNYDRETFLENEPETNISTSECYGMIEGADPYIWYLERQAPSGGLTPLRLVRYNKNTGSRSTLDNAISNSNSRTIPQNNLIRAFGSIWLVDYTAKLVKRIDESTNTVTTTISTDSGSSYAPFEIVATDSEIWCICGTAASMNGYGYAILRIDTTANTLTGTPILPPSSRFFWGQMAYRNGFVYYTDRTIPNIFGETSSSARYINTTSLTSLSFFAFGVDEELTIQSLALNSNGNLWITAKGSSYATGIAFHFKIDENGLPIRVRSTSNNEQNKFGANSHIRVLDNETYFYSDENIHSSSNNVNLPIGFSNSPAGAVNNFLISSTAPYLFFLQTINTSTFKLVKYNENLDTSESLDITSSIPASHNIKKAISGGGKIWIFTGRTGTSSGQADAKVFVVDEEDFTVGQIGSISLGGSPVYTHGAVYDNGYVWAVTSSNLTNNRPYQVMKVFIDTNTNTIDFIERTDASAAINSITSSRFADIIWAEGYIWVAMFGGDFYEATGNRIWKIDPSNSDPVDLLDPEYNAPFQVPLPIQFSDSSGLFRTDVISIAVTGGKIWISLFTNGRTGVAPARYGHRKYDLTSYQLENAIYTDGGGRLRIFNNELWAINPQGLASVRKYSIINGVTLVEYYLSNTCQEALVFNGFNIWVGVIVTGAASVRSSIYKLDTSADASLISRIYFNLSRKQPTAILIEGLSSITNTFFSKNNTNAAAAIVLDLFGALQRIPALRQKQRDDNWNTPRSRFGPNAGGQPTSVQDSLRSNWGSNTYL